VGVKMDETGAEVLDLDAVPDVAPVKPKAEAEALAGEAKNLRKAKAAAEKVEEPAEAPAPKKRGSVPKVPKKK
ncbi:MAG TPA: hypothetical protein VK181_18525, partial [Rhizobium sp.]|nr:hypothetical protein [Rhizobium sp.]